MGNLFNEWKFVVGRRSDIDRVVSLIDRLGSPEIVSLQPISQSEKATQLCFKACLDFGFYFSLQIHKYVGVQ